MTRPGSGVTRRAAGQDPGLAPRRRWRRGSLAEIAAAAGALLAGCVSIPGDGPVVEGRKVDETSRPTVNIQGLVGGYDCGPGCREFRWGNATTRGQLAKVLANALGP